MGLQSAHIASALRTWARDFFGLLHLCPVSVTKTPADAAQSHFTAEITKLLSSTAFVVHSPLLVIRTKRDL
jgi:hypothetical protein